MTNCSHNTAHKESENPSLSAKIVKPPTSAEVWNWVKQNKSSFTTHIEPKKSKIEVAQKQSMDPHQPKIEVEEIDRLIFLGWYDQAESLLVKQAELDPQNLGWLLRNATLRYYQQQFSQANAILDKIDIISAQNPFTENDISYSSKILRAKLLRETGMRALVNKITDELMQLNPLKDEAYVLRAQLLTDQGWYEEAAKVLLRAEDNGIDSYALLFMKAKIFLKTKDYFRAEKMLSVLANIGEQKLGFESQLVLVELLLKISRLEEAEIFLRELDLKNPGSYEYHFLRGLYYYKMTDYDQAEKSLVQAINRRTNDSQARFYLAHIYYFVKGKQGRGLQYFYEVSRLTQDKELMNKATAMIKSEEGQD